MKKRLRKKLHKAEFKELGFELQFDLPDSTLSQDDYLEFCLRFLKEAIEENGLLCVGGIGVGGRLMIVKQSRGSVTEEQRAIVVNWLNNEPLVQNVRVGEFRDAWYGPKSLDYSDVFMR
ncbi:MAG: 50S ribosome-binding protein YggL [Bacteroidales bacterium]|jgi:uncharacterized protein|nr:50S ribosome-binding protein YggL [Bacteroidales bacterium]MDD3161249.1 50S ribosome-binding protein YggL [Bacteroidales bacterium]